jgi:tetratricopeptide (TPR) repeat protein
MARAAVKAKQQARAKAQPAKARARGRRRHSGGGNPNQQLFFMRLRRGQRWLYLLLAIVFAVTFAGVGVGSGSGGLSDLYSGLFGSGSNPVSDAKSEIKKHPQNPKGYHDLAAAYETKGDNTQAMSALQSYLRLKKKDGNVWSELGNLQASQAQTYVAQYQSAQQAASLADPSAPFQPGGSLAQAVGTNPAYQGASQQASTQTSALYQKAIAALTSAVSSYKNAFKYQPHNATAALQLATAAENAGDTKTAISALKSAAKLDPQQRKPIEAQIKQLQAPPPTVHSSGGTKSKSGKK